MPASKPTSPLARWSFANFLGLVLLWGAQNWVGERFGATTLLLYLPQQPWALPSLMLLLFSIARRKGRLALLNAFALLFWSHFLLGYRPAWTRFSAAKAPGTWRVMTYNIERGAGGLDGLERAIRAQKPDIVCLQEAQGVQNGRPFAPGARLAARFPGWHHAQSGDVMTLSAWPLLSQASFPLRGTRRILETTWQTPRGSLRVLNIHVSTSFQPQSHPATGRWNRILQIARDARPAAQARLEQTAPIRAAIARRKSGALLVAGDFNTPPRGLFYRRLSRGLQDAWPSGGRGFGGTYPSRLPLLPIDHVLTRGLGVQQAWVPDVRASDHRPLIVDFRF